MSGMGNLVGGTVTELQVTGRGGIRTRVAAAVLNVTATDPQTSGYITVFPCGGSKPNASNLNFERGDTIANTVFAAVSQSGKVCIYASVATHVIVDGNGYLPAESALGALVPARLLDSRGPGLTVDGVASGMGRLVSGTVTELVVAGRGGVPGNAGAAVLNVTASAAQSSGYLTVYPCDQPEPNASNLNFTAGQTIPNAVLAKLGANGTACVFTSANVDLIVDVNGWLPAA